MINELSNTSISGMAKTLLRSKNVVIFMHENPDADTIGSALVTAEILNNLGKNAYPVCCDKIPTSLLFMTDGRRDYTIEDVPSGVNVDLYMSTDVASKNQLGKYKDYSDKVQLCIDHHSIRDLTAKKMFIDTNSSACTEIIYRVMLRIFPKRNISKKTASLLYAGLAADTGGFRYLNTTPYTHKVAAKLIEYGADHALICHELFEAKSKNALAVEAYAQEHVEYLCDGKIAYVKLYLEDRAKVGFEDEDTYDVINTIRRAEGVQIAILARQKDEETFKISTRAQCNVNLASICAELGGGGHPGAAGCSVKKEDVDESVKYIIRKCGFDV